MVQPIILFNNYLMRGTTYHLISLIFLLKNLINAKTTNNTENQQIKKKINIINI